MFRIEEKMTIWLYRSKRLEFKKNVIAIFTVNNVLVYLSKVIEEKWNYQTLLD